MKKILYVAAPVILCGGCAVLGHEVTPEQQTQAVDTGTAIVNAVAAVTGQGWAVPIISILGATVAGALNTHHGVRNVAVATGKTLGKLVVKAVSAAAPAPKV